MYFDIVKKKRSRKVDKSHKIKRPKIMESSKIKKGFRSGKDLSIIENLDILYLKIEDIL